jgi:hypothetical protein
MLRHMGKPDIHQIDLAGLVAAWGQAQIRADRAGSPEAFRIVDDGAIC